MYIYDELPEEFNDAVKDYRYKGEEARISGPVEYGGRRFYQIEFIKKSLFNLKKNAAGIIVIDEFGHAVGGRTITALLRMFYYYKMFFYSYKKDFASAFRSMEQLKSEEQEYKEASDAARYITGEGITGADNVKFVIDKLPSMRREANDALETLIKKIDYYKMKEPFNQEILDELVLLYDKVMVMSFQRVKFINGASDFYNSVKKDLMGVKRKFKSRINKKVQDGLIRLENIISFFINILNYYGEVISYSDERYLKHIHKKDDEEIDKIYHMVRNKH